MTSVWILFTGFFIANILWFVAVWNNYSYFEIVIPKYTGSSYDPNKNEELESVLLKSMQKYIQKYFKVKNSGYTNIISEKMSVDSDILGESLPKNLTLADENKNFELNEMLKNYKTIKVTNSSKFSMFLDKEKKLMYILKISNEADSMSKFDSRAGEISLSYIPIENFLLNSSEKDKFDISKSLIKQCWSSKFFGRIIGAVASTDKSNFGIFYRMVKGHTINYRIRYFHNITCENTEIEKSDMLIEEEYKEYLNKFKNVKDKNENIEPGTYFEINEKAGNGDVQCGSEAKNQLPKTILTNYFNDESYDDFSLKGNTPISAMSVKKNVIAYARDFDYREFYILRREKNIIKTNNTSTESESEYSRSWKVSLLGPQIDKTLNPFFHTNSLKFVNDGDNDYKLMQIYISMNTTGIYGNGYIMEANHTDYKSILNNMSNETNTTNYLSLNFITVKLTDEVLGNYEDFNMDNSIKEMKKFMKPTVYSNTNHKNLIFEFFRGVILYLRWNKNSDGYLYYLNPNETEKVDRIIACSNNENIIVKYEKDKNMKYIFRDKDTAGKYHASFYYYDITRNISFRSAPKQYREKEGVAYFIETINEKTILFILNDDGVLIGMDFTHITKKWQGKNWLYFTFFSDFNYTASLIMLANLITLAVYIRFFRRRSETTFANITERRNQEINQVIQDIIRLNSLQQMIGDNMNFGNNNANANVLNQNQNQNEDQNQIPNEYVHPNINAAIQNRVNEINLITQAIANNNPFGDQNDILNNNLSSDDSVDDNIGSNERQENEDNNNNNNNIQ